MTMKLSTKLNKTTIKPGMYLRDKEFTGLTGVTRYSLEFWNEIKGRINEVVKAEILLDKRQNPRLQLTTLDDVKVVLYGCNAGYGGEGPRGTVQILKEAGFNPDRVEEVVFHQETFTLRRKAKVEAA
ncbi:hypothetical protein [Peribacillus frigoritolerans]|uniref:hypothetical protein n=1 Tax=Peribacillus frigoritolerans TaxID=450367 RepID=UPI00207A5229|nr:hypothetical protein [Peribacillus frigoritolerans]USK77684.1 hypothetical protein LIT31_26375 [Peribacillus frigoritolerans]USK77765.1 hypothetical protein LIT31_25905 [Peribacillus frigoritolerans]USK77903.1 hypothetical protein LIT31_26835 [Peribacillus frigoritolerans]